MQLYRDALAACEQGSDRGRPSQSFTSARVLAPDPEASASTDLLGRR